MGRATGGVPSVTAPRADAPACASVEVLQAEAEGVPLAISPLAPPTKPVARQPVARHPLSRLLDRFAS